MSEWSSGTYTGPLGSYRWNLKCWWPSKHLHALSSTFNGLIFCMSALNLSTNFTLTSSFVFGHCLSSLCYRGGAEAPHVPRTKVPNPEIFDCWCRMGHGREIHHQHIWDKYKCFRARGSHTPAIIASSGTKLRFNCLYPPVLPLLSSAAAAVAATFFYKSRFSDGSRLPPCWDSVGETSTFQDRLKTVPPKKQEESAGACREWLCTIVCVYRLQLSWQMALVSLIGNSERKLFLGERPLCSLTKGMRRGKEGPLHGRFNNSTSSQPVLYDTVMQWFLRELARWPGSPFP